MKVKFANRIYEVLFTKELAGLTMYAVEDEPNHIDWLINVEVIDAEKKELKKIEQNPTEDSGKNSDNITTEEKDMTEYKKGFECGKQRVLKYPEDFNLCKKPSWSEEDSVMINKLLAVVKLYYDRSGNDLDKQSCISFLKSLKDRVQLQPKQEWSEEDREMIDLLIAIFRVSYPDGVYKANPIDTIDMKSVSSSEIIDWLKSLKPQNTWKPSDEQMEALANALSLAKSCGEESAFDLRTLYEQLKALHHYEQDT